MSQSDKVFENRQVRKWLQPYIQDLVTCCDNIQVVGSVRRGRPEVHDAEIMVISRPGTGRDLFGMPTRMCMLDEDFTSLVASWKAAVINGGPKLRRLLLPEGIALQLHMSNPASWAVETVIRTGPAEFSHKCVMPRRHGGYLPSDCRIHDGWQVWRGSKNIPMATEREFLEFLDLGWIEPEKRNEHLSVSVETTMAKRRVA